MPALLKSFRLKGNSSPGQCLEKKSDLLWGWLALEWLVVGHHGCVRLPVLEDLNFSRLCYKKDQGFVYLGLSNVLQHHKD